MTVPSLYDAILLGLGVFRICRLVGWDDITASLRARFVMSDAAHSQWAYALNALEKIAADPWDYAARHRTAFALDVGRGLGITTGTITLPPLVTDRIDSFVGVSPLDVRIAPPVGGLPISVADRVVPFSKSKWYVSKLIRCPWCVGWWISLLVWIAYEAAPHGTLVVMSLFALSALSGLVTKNLDK